MYILEHPLLEIARKIVKLLGLALNSVYEYSDRRFIIAGLKFRTRRIIDTFCE